MRSEDLAAIDSVVSKHPELDGDSGDRWEEYIAMILNALDWEDGCECDEYDWSANNRSQEYET